MFILSKVTNQLTASHFLAVHYVEGSTAHSVSASRRRVEVTRVVIVVEVHRFTRGVRVGTPFGTPSWCDLLAEINDENEPRVCQWRI